MWRPEGRNGMVAPPPCRRHTAQGAILVFGLTRLWLGCGRVGWCRLDAVARSVWSECGQIVVSVTIICNKYLEPMANTLHEELSAVLVMIDICQKSCRLTDK